MKDFFRKLLLRITIGDEWEQKRLLNEVEKCKPFVDRVQRHNGRIKTSPRGGIKVEFCCDEDERAYYKDLFQNIKDKHGDAINRIFK